MHKLVRAFLCLVMLLVVSACASGGSADGTTRPRARQDLITSEELRTNSFSNAYDLVASLRPRWLQTRGKDTLIGKPGEVQVHMDDNRLGGVSALRNIPTAGIQFLQFIDPVDAAGRWGLDYGHGAIIISTRPQ